MYKVFGIALILAALIGVVLPALVSSNQWPEFATGIALLIGGVFWLYKSIWRKYETLVRKNDFDFTNRTNDSL